MMSVPEQVWTSKTTYEQWMEKQNIPIYRAYHIPDLKDLELGHWARSDSEAAFIVFSRADDAMGTMVTELLPGAKSAPQRHFYEEIIYVLSGRGATEVWYDGQTPRMFEWGAGAMFTIPLNAHFRHYNGSGQIPARFVSVTLAPLFINLFRDEEYIFNNPSNFPSRYDAREDYFTWEGIRHPGRAFETNFIPNCVDLPLEEWKERGAGGRNLFIELGENTLAAHISEFPVGTYKKAHRHGPEFHIIILKGEGYSLMWPEGEEIQQYRWHPGSMFVPPDRWFHQHFNVGPEPARYLAIRWGSFKNKVSTRSLGAVAKSTRLGGDQIEYEDQDPKVHALFVEECAQRGVTVNM